MNQTAWMEHHLVEAMADIEMADTADTQKTGEAAFVPAVFVEKLEMVVFVRDK
jgi:hypothetical protein